MNCKKIETVICDGKLKIIGKDELEDKNFYIEFLKIGDNYFNQSSILSIICKDYSIEVNCSNNFTHYITIKQSIQIATEHLYQVYELEKCSDKSSNNLNFIKECKKQFLTLPS